MGTSGWDATDEKSHVHKFYIVPMLPYPSGNLHVGHIRNYAICDILCRYAKAKGLNPLMPMGWDAFGLPAENAATDHNVLPSSWVESNIRRMKDQMLSTSLAVDWRREIITSNPNYFQWNQLLFLGMLSSGLVRREMSIANWDPLDCTTLSNEQIVNGKGWRSGAYVQQRRVKSYFLGIRSFAEKLAVNLPDLSWPQHVKTMQQNWIGRHMSLEVPSYSNVKLTEEVSSFNSDFSSFWVSNWMLVVTPLSILSNSVVRHNLVLREFVRLRNLGLSDELDQSFQKFRGVDISLRASVPQLDCKPRGWASCWLGDFRNAEETQPVAKIDVGTKDATLFLRINNLLCQNTSGAAPQIPSQDDVRTTMKMPNSSFSCSLRIQDWDVSRQRSWGTFIPTRCCQVCGIVPTDATALPFSLEKKSHLSACNRCCCETNPEEDTLDTFFDSSWYFLRFPSYNSRTSIIDSRADYWLPLDVYIGGIEHSVLHLLYSRFVCQALKTFGLISDEEPIAKLVTQGTVTSEAFYSKTAEGKVIWLAARDIGFAPLMSSADQKESKRFSAGKCKMSKSKKNGADPIHLIGSWGSDAMRLFILSHSPLDRKLDWTTAGICGVIKFLNRCLLIRETEVVANCWGRSRTSVPPKLFSAIQKTSDCYNSLDCHTIFLSLTSMLDLIVGCSIFLRDRGFRWNMMSRLLSLAYPVIPHLSFKMWRRLGSHLRFGTISSPKIVPVLAKRVLASPSCILTIQIDGKAKRDVAVVDPLAKGRSDIRITWEALLSVVLVSQKKLSTVLRVIIFSNRIANVVTVSTERKVTC